jgi:DNA polymerase-1
MKRNTMLIIDGNHLAWRCWLQPGLQKLATKGGVPSGVVYGFLNTLHKLVSRFRPRRTVVVFDGPGGVPYRMEALPEYKGQKEPHPPAWLGQVESVKNILATLGIPVVQYSGIEADDTIAWLTKKWHKKRLVVIASSDSDFLQLLRYPNVLIWDDRSSTAWDKRTFAEKYGFPPQWIPLYKSMIGETSDNIPGIKGIGKGSAKLVVQHLLQTKQPPVAAMAGIAGEQKALTKKIGAKRAALIVGTLAAATVIRNLALIELPHFSSKPLLRRLKPHKVRHTVIASKRACELLSVYECNAFIKDFATWSAPFGV